MSLILIAGGQDKNLDYKPLANVLKSTSGRTNTGLVVLFGENKRKIKKALAKTGVPVKLSQNIKNALGVAYRHAICHTPHSAFINIIFSPGAASFDMFKNYADRGKQFKKEVLRIHATNSATTRTPSESSRWRFGLARRAHR